MIIILYFSIDKGINCTEY